MDEAAVQVLLGQPMFTRRDHIFVSYHLLHSPLVLVQLRLLELMLRLKRFCMLLLELLRLGRITNLDGVVVAEAGRRVMRLQVD